MRKFLPALSNFNSVVSVVVTPCSVPTSSTSWSTNFTEIRKLNNRHFGSLSLINRHFSASSTSTTTQEAQTTTATATATAAPTTTVNRWLMVIPAFATHCCLGTPFAWSVMASPLTREAGFVTSAASDWTLAQVTLPLSIAFAFHGLGATAFGKWQFKVGPRVSIRAAGAMFGTGWLVAAAGISTHQLWMLYAGYGVMGGSAIGLGYTPPVQTLIEWFPDRKGLASAMCIAGFGSGALTFGPMVGKVMGITNTPAEYLGTVDAVKTITQDGKLFIEAGSQLREVVVVNSAEIAKLPYSDLADGVYAVATGNTGAATALAICGAVYASVVIASSFFIQRPPAGYVPPGYVPPATAVSASRYVHVDDVMKTPQFWCLFGTFGCVATGGMGLFSVAKPMMSEVFSGALPDLVTQTFAAAFVSTLAAANLSGRIGWGQVSDIVGRRPIFYMFTFGSIPLYFAIPYLINTVITSGEALPLYGFIGTTFLAVTFFGGVYATLPAYEADLFGSRMVGAIHGRTLLASTAAALVGPTLLLTLRSRSESNAIHDLLDKADPIRFQEVFGAPLSSAEQLIETKTLTIAKLMEIMPAGVPDPTPFIYDSTMYTVAGIMALGAVSHFLLKPVNPKYFTHDPEVKK